MSKMNTVELELITFYIQKLLYMKREDSRKSRLFKQVRVIMNILDVVLCRSCCWSRTRPSSWPIPAK